MQPASLIALVLIVTVFGGCVEGDDSDDEGRRGSPVQRGAVPPSVYLDRLSKEVYTEIVQENVKVPSFDGKLMDNVVYRPRTEDGVKVPVFINFSPYWSNSAPAASLRGDNFAKHMIDYFVPRGYAIVLSSLRGTGYSEGCFNIGGDTEKKDAVEVIEYFAAQPWSNGSIAAGGKSYDGTTPQGAATLAPPALKAIFPVSPIAEMYKYSYKGGIAYRPTFTTTYFQGMSTSQTWQSEPGLIPEDAACPDLPDHVKDSYGTGYTGDYTEYWQERNYSKDASKVTAALFYVHGLEDWNVKSDQALPWLNAIPADVPKKVWLHNWTKQPEGGHVYPMRDDWNVTMLRFLDETLKGIKTGIFDEPAYQIQDSQGVWHWEEEWPPARAVPTPYYFGSKEGEGVIDPNEPLRSGVRTFQDSGQAANPNTVSDDSAAPGVPGAFLRYQSEPLSEDLRYSGVPRVHVEASTNLAVGKIVAILIDYTPGGNAKVINWGGLNFRHRVATENPQPVTPNEVYDLTFEMFPQDDIIEAGHSLVLVLAGGSAPGSTPNGFGYDSSQAYRSIISVSENENAFVELPVITEVSFEEPQPIPVPCFAC